MIEVRRKRFEGVKIVPNDTPGLEVFIDYDPISPTVPTLRILEDGKIKLNVDLYRSELIELRDGIDRYLEESKIV